MTSFFFRAFGLSLACDAVIPGLTPTAAVVPDVRVHIGDFPSEVAPVARAGTEIWGDGGDPDHAVDAVSVRSVAGGASLMVAYGDGMRFLVDRTGDEVWAVAPPGVSIETTGTYLLGPIFGLVLRLRGTVCIHASVVAIGTGRAAGAVAIVGPAGAGKSTIAAACALRGHRVVSDDIAALVCDNGRWATEPAAPTIRLWDDSVAMLFGRPTALPLMAPGWNKRQLDLRTLDGAFILDGRLPLTGAYVLDTGNRPSPPVAAARLSPRDALMALVPNTYANVLLDADMRAAEFQTLSSIVSTVPVWRIHAPENAAELATFCEMVTQGTPITVSKDPQPGSAPRPRATEDPPGDGS
jgi:hypothetical protein